MQLKKVIERIFPQSTHSVFRGMAALLTGAGLARLVSLGSVPILTRMYSPTDYGTLAVFTAAVTVSAPLINLRFAQAIPLPKSDRLAVRLAAAAFVSTLAVSLLLATTLSIGSDTVFGWISMPTLATWWWLVVLGAAGISAYEILATWATRKRAYRVLARTTVTQSVLGETVKLALGMAGVKPLGLLLGQLANQGAGLTTLFIAFKSDLTRLNADLTFKKIARAAALYAEYPTLRLPSHLLLIMAMQAPVVLSANFFTAGEAGQLGLALMTLAVPVALIGDSMSRAFYAEISAMGRNRGPEIKALTLALVKRLLIIAIPCSLAFLLLGQWLFTTAFGDQWLLAGKLASVLSIYLATQFIQKPVSYILFVFDGQRQLLLINIQRLVLAVGTFYGAHALDLSIVETIAVYSVALSVHYLASIVLAIRLIPSPPTNSTNDE